MLWLDLLLHMNLNDYYSNSSLLIKITEAIEAVDTKYIASVMSDKTKQYYKNDIHNAVLTASNNLYCAEFKDEIGYNKDTNQAVFEINIIRNRSC